MSSKVIKLTWAEVAEMVRTELRKIIGKDVFCMAKSDDDTYWDISFPLEDACLCDAASINLLIANWYRFDSDLRHAMEGMRRYYEKKEAVGNENKAVSDRP